MLWCGIPIKNHKKCLKLLYIYTWSGEGDRALIKCTADTKLGETNHCISVQNPNERELDRLEEQPTVTLWNLARTNDNFCYWNRGIPTLKGSEFAAGLQESPSDQVGSRLHLNQQRCPAALWGTWTGEQPHNEGNDNSPLLSTYYTTSQFLLDCIATNFGP